MKTIVALFVSIICGSASFCHALIIYNGDFETGTLAGWTTFTTPNGSLGPGLPTVTQFDVTGSGTSSYAAEFQVGQTTVDRTRTEEGGGIYQMFDVSAGEYNIGADFAAQNNFLLGLGNAEGGIETVSIDSVTVGTVDFGFIDPGQILRGSVLTTTYLSAGPHEITIELTRGYLNGSYGGTPLQYVDDVQVTPVPEPSLAALGVCGLAMAVLRKRLGSRECASTTVR